MNAGKHCWINTRLKQRNWEGKHLYLHWGILLWSKSILSWQFSVNNVFFILSRKVEEGLERGISLDSASVVQSSQYHFIQSKPDYHSLLCRQQPMLHTMAITVCLNWLIVFDQIVFFTYCFWFFLFLTVSFLSWISMAIEKSTFINIRALVLLKTG